MPEVNDKKSNWWQPAIELFAQATGWIVVPILAGLFLGRWLDAKYHKSPWLLIICLAAAFVITNVGLIRQTLKAARKIEEQGKQEKQEKDREKKEIK